MIELLSIDLSNYCSKQCEFCYNHSNKQGNTIWTTTEVISFANDCINNGIKSISLGGGEPFEYEGIFDIIDALQPKVYLSITTNGLPLETDAIWQLLSKHQPDKIHVTIHQPDDSAEVERVLNLLKRIGQTQIKPGVNLLVNKNKLQYCKVVYQKMRSILTPEQIILVPQRFKNTPSAKDLVIVSGKEAFQSPSCLLQCKKPERFVSVSWDKKVNFCSYASGKQDLKTLDYNGLEKALKLVSFKSCQLI